MDGDGAADLVVAGSGAQIFFQDPMTGSFSPITFVGN
jgi:hypothetical protein